MSPTPTLPPCHVRIVRPRLSTALAALLVLAACDSPAFSQEVRNLAATAPEPHEVRLTWADPAQPGVRYRILRGVDRGPFQELADVDASAARYTDSTVSPGTLYAYRVVPVGAVQTRVIRGGEPAAPVRVPLSGRGELTLLVTDGGDGNGNDHGVWGAPALIRRDGTEVPLATLQPRIAEVGWQEPRKPAALSISGKTLPDSIWAHAPSRYVYELDGQHTAFRALVGIDQEQGRAGSVAFRAEWTGRDQAAVASASVRTADVAASPGRTTYHLDPTSGNDGSPGTAPDQAWKSPARVGRVRLAAGDRLLIKGGSVINGRLVVEGAGTAEEPIIIDTYGGGTAHVDSGESELASLQLNGAEHLQVRNLVVRDGRAVWQGNRSAVLIRSARLDSVNSVDLSGLSIRGKADGATAGFGNLITIEAATADGWNLLDREWVDLTLRGRGEKAVGVWARIENAGAGRMRDAVSDRADVGSSGETTLRLPIVARPLDPGYQVFRPYFMYVRSMNVRAGTVDPRAVRRLTVQSEGGAADVTLARIRTGGAARTWPVPFFPFIDEYGQYVHGHWHGKIYGDSDLARWRDAEAAELASRPGPSDWNRYGGWAGGPQLEATGFFRAEKYNGKWWLVDPEGRLFWSYGPTGVGFGGDYTPLSEREFWFRTLPDRNGPLAAFYGKGRGARFMYYEFDKPYVSFDFAGANLVRKYGPDYERQVRERSHQRLRSWGFNTIGNWSDESVYRMRKTPYTVAIHYGAMDFGHHHEIFSPDFRRQLRERLEREAETTANDPWNIGYFVDNELDWGPAPDGQSISRRALEAPAEQLTKREFVKDLRSKYDRIESLNKAWGTDYASWEDLLGRRRAPGANNPAVAKDFGAFGRKFIETYFSTVREEVKRVAPNTMYLGVRFHGHIDRSVMLIAAKYCDVISYNIYDANPAGRANQYLGVVDKPILAGEWGFGSDLQQTPFGRAENPDEEWDPMSRPEYLRAYMSRAIRHPLMVGAHFFQYRDQPISGRPDGEAVLRGFINTTDTPNALLVEANRKVGETLYRSRAE